MRRSSVPILVAALAGLAAIAAVPAAAGQPSMAPGLTLASPEDAVGEYLAGVAGADVERILGATAIDEVSEGYRFDESVDRFQAFMPVTMLAPAVPFYVDINRARQTDQVLRQVLMLAYGLLSGEEIDGSPIVPVDKAWAQDFAERVDPARLAGIKVLDVRFPDPTYQDDERYQEVVAAQAATYGADELTERLALIYYEGQSYVVGFTLLRYGDEWKVGWQNSAISGMDSLGTAKPMSTDEFESLTTAGED
jgi:hypothetical protein